MPQPKKKKPAAPPAEQASGAIVTVTAPGARRVIVAGQIFPAGEPVENVPDQTIQALQEMPGVTVDVAGKPDADTPEPDTEE